MRNLIMFICGYQCLVFLIACYVLTGEQSFQRCLSAGHCGSPVPERHAAGRQLQRGQDGHHPSLSRNRHEKWFVAPYIIHLSCNLINILTTFLQCYQHS